MNDLLAIFDILEKSKLVEHCKNAVVYSTDLANLILASQAEVIAIRHIPVFQHHHPEHLILTNEDLSALGSNGVGPLRPRAQKTVRKLDEMFAQRRMFCGHLFWMPESAGEWHLFYFDQRDVSDRNNHWQHGSHIHLMSMVTHPRLDPNDLLGRLASSKRPKLGGSLHIRYARDTPSI